MLLGVLELELDKSGEAVGARNAVMTVHADGSLGPRYDKSHLVPYGEYLPMRPVLSAIGLSRLAPGDIDFWPGPGPHTLDLGVSMIGLEPGSWLDVDDTMRVHGSDWLYAVGDVNHRALLTHQGKYQARAAGDVIAARARGAAVDDQPWGTHVATADHVAVPQVVFTSPEVAAVGMTAAQAQKEGLAVRVVDYDLANIAGASTRAAHYRGQARAVVDTDRDVLVGATFVGADMAELLQAATIAIVGEVPLARLWHAVPAYPTLSEVWLRWLEAIGRPV